MFLETTNSLPSKVGMSVITFPWKLIRETDSNNCQELSWFRKIAIHKIWSQISPSVWSFCTTHTREVHQEEKGLQTQKILRTWHTDINKFLSWYENQVTIAKQRAFCPLGTALSIYTHTHYTYIHIYLHTHTHTHRVI